MHFAVNRFHLMKTNLKTHSFAASIFAFSENYENDFPKIRSESAEKKTVFAYNPLQYKMDVKSNVKKMMILCRKEQSIFTNDGVFTNKHRKKPIF